MSYQRKTNYQPQQSSKETILDVMTYPILALEDRKITKETAGVFGVRTALSEKDGKTPVARYFPQYDERGTVTGFIKRDLTKSKHEDGHFTSVGKTSPRFQLFGQKAASENNRPKKVLFISEGHEDAMAAYQAVVDASKAKGGEYANLKPFVVSISHGTGNAVESIQSNAAFIESFDEVVLAFDNDFATEQERKRGIVKGRDAVQEVAGSLPSVNFTTVDFGMGCKDSNDYLLNGFDAQLVKLLSFDRKKIELEKIVTVSSISDEEFLRPRIEGVLTEVFPELDKKLHGIRLRELTTVTAPSGVGKSTCTKIIFNQLRKAGKRIGVIALEEDTSRTVRSFVAMDLGVGVNKFVANPLECGFSKDDILEVKRKIESDNQIILLDHFGSMQTSTLMQKLYLLHHVYGCEYIMVDHTSMLVSGRENNDERKDLDVLYTELAAFCASNDVAVVAICHINRDVDGAPKKGEEDQPYWINVRLKNLRGSAAIEQLSWNVLSLEPEIMPDKSRGRVRWVILKSREWGTLGVCDVFKLDEETGKVILYDNSY